MTSKQAMSPETQALAAQAREAAEGLFGRGVTETVGVTQVSATVRAPDGLLHVIDIGSDAPKSEYDFFALNFARARADAILTSAENIRREPRLSHELAGTAAASLIALRQTWKKSAAPLCVILSASGSLPLQHPVWSDGTTKVVLTLPDARERIQLRLGSRARVVGLELLTPRTALTWLSERAKTIDVEAGPTTSSQLYAAPPMVEELLLSRFEGELEPTALGRALPSDDILFHGLTCVHETRREEASGPWVFQRWLRR